MTTEANGSSNGYAQSGADDGHGEDADLAAILTSSSEADEPITAMLARAMIYSHDADRKLEQAQALKSEAEKYRSQVQRQSVEATEELCNQMREEAEEEADAARRLRTQAEEKWSGAHAELERATVSREEADAYMAAVRTEAEDYRRTVMLQADEETKRIRGEARTEANTSVAIQKERVDEDIRRAMAGIEKMQQAVQAELEAQQAFTEALRMKALSPRGRESTEVPSTDQELSPEADSKPKRRSPARKTRVR